VQFVPRTEQPFVFRVMIYFIEHRKNAIVNIRMFLSRHILSGICAWNILCDCYTRFRLL